MKTTVSICSREEMQKRFIAGLPSDAAVISFYDPKSERTPKDYERLDYTGHCDRVFYVGVHDIDIEILGDYDMTLETYFPEAGKLAEFIYNAYRDGCQIICQCEYGQSRSAACAAAILEHFSKNGIQVFADYRYYPNQLVFNKTLDALNKYKKEKQKND